MRAGAAAIAGYVDEEGYCSLSSGESEGAGSPGKLTTQPTEREHGRRSRAEELAAEGSGSRLVLICGGVRPSASRARMLGPFVGDVRIDAVWGPVLASSLLPALLLIAGVVGSAISIRGLPTASPTSALPSQCSPIPIAVGVALGAYSFVVLCVLRPFLGISHNVVEALVSLAAAVLSIVWGAMMIIADSKGNTEHLGEEVFLYRSIGGESNAAVVLALVAICSCRYPLIAARALRVTLPAVVRVERTYVTEQGRSLYGKISTTSSPQSPRYRSTGRGGASGREGAPSVGVGDGEKTTRNTHSDGNSLVHPTVPMETPLCGPADLTLPFSVESVSCYKVNTDQADAKEEVDSDPASTDGIQSNGGSEGDGDCVEILEADELAEVYSTRRQRGGRAGSFLSSASSSSSAVPGVMLGSLVRPPSSTKQRDDGYSTCATDQDVCIDHGGENEDDYF